MDAEFEIERVQSGGVSQSLMSPRTNNTMSCYEV